MIGRLRRGLIRPPVLAMVDAFVGGTAILLILIILSSNLQDNPGSQPQADVVLRCADGAVVAAAPVPGWLTATPPLPPAEAAGWIATHPRPDRLMTRIRLEADQRAFRCVARFQQAVGQMNDTTDDVITRDPAQKRAILLLTVVMIDPPEVPPGEPPE